MPGADAADDQADATSDADLTVESCPDATIMPVSPYPQPRRPYAFRFGVFDGRGRLVRPSLLHRSFGQVGFAADPLPPTSTIGRDVLFAGHLSYHFGHFLLESLARLWFARDHPELPIVWACRPGPPQAGLLPWQRQVLDVLRLSNEVLLLTEPTRFRSVHVPWPGYRVQDAFSARHLAFLATYPVRPRDPDLRLWLSRAGLASAFSSLHAPRLEAQLADRGWTVVHPERLAIAEQLELLATATRVAGEEGSAFHLLVLLADVSGLQVDIICRDPGRPLDRQNGNYGTIARARGLRQRLHLVEGERVLAAEAGRVRKVATTLAGHLEAVGVTRANHQAVPSSPRPLAMLVHALAPACPLGRTSRWGPRGQGPIRTSASRSGTWSSPGSRTIPGASRQAAWNSSRCRPTSSSPTAPTSACATTSSCWTGSILPARSSNASWPADATRAAGTIWLVSDPRGIGSAADAAGGGRRPRRPRRRVSAAQRQLDGHVRRLVRQRTRRRPARGPPGRRPPAAGRRRPGGPAGRASFRAFERRPWRLAKERASSGCPIPSAATCSYRCALP